MSYICKFCQYFVLYTIVLLYYIYIIYYIILFCFILLFYIQVHYIILYDGSKKRNKIETRIVSNDIQFMQIYNI